MTLIVNFFGGPGTGKSVAATNIFAWLKSHHKNAEYVPEFAKDLVWDNSVESISDQLYLIGVQHHRLYRLINKVDIIITDCPVLLGIPYMHYPTNLSKYPNHVEIKAHLEQVLLRVHNEHKSINFYINREENMPYIQTGRNEDLEGSKAVDEYLKNFITKYNLPNFYNCKTSTAITLSKQVLSREFKIYS